jgi:hypothetical protein
VYDEDLANLDEWLRRLKVEYDIYFNGNRKRPPDDLRARVEKLTKKLSEAPNMSFSQRFRYTTLVSRFYVHRDLWRRTMMERENSGENQEPPALDRHTTAAPEIQISITDPETEKDKVRQLYDALLAIRGKHSKDAPGISYEKFAKYISTQTEGIRGKYGCSSVLFKVALEEDAIRFTAVAEN